MKKGSWWCIFRHFQCKIIRHVCTFYGKNKISKWKNVTKKKLKKEEQCNLIGLFFNRAFDWPFFDLLPTNIRGNRACLGGQTCSDYNNKVRQGPKINGLEKKETLKRLLTSFEFSRLLSTNFKVNKLKDQKKTFAAPGVLLSKVVPHHLIENLRAFLLSVIKNFIFL